jgi:hypothetical protein
MLEDNLGCPEMAHCIDYAKWRVSELTRQESEQE